MEHLCCSNFMLQGKSLFFAKGHVSLENSMKTAN